jgi:hypothetical protein
VPMNAQEVIFWKKVAGTEVLVMATTSGMSGVGQVYVDSNFGFWAAGGSSVSYMPCTGVDGSGNPTYGTLQSWAFPAPHTGTAGGRVCYDPATDTLYALFFTAADPVWAGSDKVGGTTVCRYNNWLLGSKTFQWSSVVRYAPNAVGAGLLMGPVCMDLVPEVNRLYLGQLTDEPSSGHTAPAIEVHSTDGSYKGHFYPSASAGQNAGWIDCVDGLQARKVPSGEVLITVEEDFQAKNLLHRL